MTFQQKYPEAFEDDCGTVWINKAAADAADWTYKNGDAFMDNVLGWSWADAEDNFAENEKRAKRTAFWSAHPHLRSFCWFMRSRYRFASMFVRTVWREWHGCRISWSTAWKIAGDTWLR